MLRTEVIDFDFKVILVIFDLEFCKIRLVHAITRQRFGLESPNLYQTCILGYFWLVWKLRAIDHGLQRHFDWEFWEILLAHAITCNRFELESPNMHLEIFLTGIECGSHLAISSGFQEIAFNSPAKGCYTSQRALVIIVGSWVVASRVVIWTLFSWWVYFCWVLGHHVYREFRDLLWWGRLLFSGWGRLPFRRWGRLLFDRNGMLHCGSIGSLLFGGEDKTLFGRAYRLLCGRCGRLDSGGQVWAEESYGFLFKW